MSHNHLSSEERDGGAINYKNLVIALAAVGLGFFGILVIGLAWYFQSNAGVSQGQSSISSQTLKEARLGHVTRLTKQKRDASVPVQPPGRVLQLVKYSSPVGELPAYLTPSGGGKSPAMIWLTGGFSNGIDAVWQPAPKDNDQTASVFWKVRGPGGTALVMMYPALRGGSSGPGVKESFYGEVDDVLAALRYLKSLHNIDSDRIYLGGHSTGGTLALLAAECSSGFRAVFAFGPVEDPATYGSTYLSYSLGDEKENSLRSPIKWLHGITSPTFVIEGTGGNIDSLRAMRSATTNANIHFLEAPKQDHFTVIYPVSALIASKIEADTGAKCNITMSEAELRAALSR